jgi:hypothetical protein
MLFPLLFLYLLGVAWCLWDRYRPLHYPRRMEGMIAFTDPQANALIAIWPITLVLTIIVILYVRIVDHLKEPRS